MFFEMISGFVLIATTGFIIYLKQTTGVCNSKKDMSGKVVIVTGANTGIGLETAKDLVHRNAKVILACRDLDRGQAAAEKIGSNSLKLDKIVVMQLDLSSLKSVRKFAADFLKRETRLDVLVHNAGVMVLPDKSMTEDGFDTIMATNYFGPFLLNHLLLPLLKNSAPARIVVVASRAHSLGHIDLEDIKGVKDTRQGLKQYGTSKLTNILFSLELSRRLEGSGVTVNSCHPGVIHTELMRHNYWWVLFLFNLTKGLLSKTPIEGAQTSIYLAVDENVEGVSGKYFSDCAIKRPSEEARDGELAKRLWIDTEKILGLEN